MKEIRGIKDFRIEFARFIFIVILRNSYLIIRDLRNVLSIATLCPLPTYALLVLRPR